MDAREGHRADRPHGSDLNAFQQSHGLNFLLANLAYRFAPGCAARCTAVVRGGAGISTPHVESTFRDRHQEQYQYGGVAWQLGAAWSTGSGAAFTRWPTRASRA